ncbi:MAG: MBOAT family protein [Melioribacteraceae bacterium]|nr:MBOAT family protein [Melioribacteraceae bacterium]
MLFNTIDFAIFLPIVFILYWSVFKNNLKIQNFFIVGVSYLFYGWWDWRFLSLILISTVVDFIVGLKLSTQENRKQRKFLLWISIIVNLGFLGFFKYYNFFLDNFIISFSFFGVSINANNLDIVLPIGISFYTFQTMSYTIDLYYKRLSATKDFIAFSAFVSFFPQLVAGPIERARNFLPQFFKKRTFDYEKAVDGLRQILWGLFKKIVIADNCAIYVDKIFANTSDYSGSTLVVGMFLFAVQIYGDFSGYSDIAIGTARLFGFKLMQNFAFPQFSRDVGEFWRRWHISLSSWFRDYLYVPLGGSKGNILIKARNVFLIFVITGFWHGAKWTFIVWGTLNAIIFSLLMLQNKNKLSLKIIAKDKKLPSITDILSITKTMLIIMFTGIFFRVTSIEHAISYILGIFSSSLFSFPEVLPKKLLITILIFIGIEWFGRENKHALENFGLNWIKPLRWSFYYLIVICIILFAGKQQTFIYFQF